jgi:hypothetical protein
MFRKINSALEKRKNQLQKRVGLKSSIEGLVKDFISLNFSQAEELFSLRSSKYENGDLFLEFTNKAVSSEIKLRSVKISTFLRDKGVQLRNIIIR